MKITEELIKKARPIKWVITDCDGVLTDAGCYYDANGELLKRFSLRDGMGVERLRNELNIETAIMTGENSEPVKRRAEKLKIEELYLFIKDKEACLGDFIKKHELSLEEIAYIGDDYNDLKVIELAGLSACPNDAVEKIKQVSDYICVTRGGYGAFREFAELIIACKKAV